MNILYNKLKIFRFFYECDSYLSRNELWEQVLIHWKNTFHLRQESETTTAFDFIEQWPIFKQSNVDSLVSY